MGVEQIHRAKRASGWRGPAGRNKREVEPTSCGIKRVRLVGRIRRWCGGRELGPQDEFANWIVERRAGLAERICRLQCLGEKPNRWEIFAECKVWKECWVGWVDSQVEKVERAMYLADVFSEHNAWPQFHQPQPPQSTQKDFADPGC
jgi:hypothetical protein